MLVVGLLKQMRELDVAPLGLLSPAACPRGRLACNAEGVRSLQRWQQVGVAREEHRYIKVPVGGAESQIQGKQHVDAFLDPPES